MKEINKTYVDLYEKEFRYLYKLQASGRTNMFGAAEYLQKEQGLDRQSSREVLAYWMDNYEEIAKELGVEV